MTSRGEQLTKELLSLLCAIIVGVTVILLLLPTARYDSHAATNDSEIALLYSLAGWCAGVVGGLITRKRSWPLLLAIVALHSLTLEGLHIYFLLHFMGMPYGVNRLRDTFRHFILNIGSRDAPHIAVLGPILGAAIGTAMGARIRRGKVPPRPPDEKILI